MPCATYQPGQIGPLVVPGKTVFLVSHQGDFNGIIDRGNGPLEIVTLQGGQVGQFVDEAMSSGAVVSAAAIPGPLPCPPDPPEDSTSTEVKAFRIVERLRRELGKSVLFDDPVSGTNNLKG